MKYSYSLTPQEILNQEVIAMMKIKNSYLQQQD